MSRKALSCFIALPLSVVADLLKYVFQDWEFAKWIAVAVLLDTMLGLVKAFIHKDISSDEFWNKFWKKMLAYISLMILSNILTNYTVGGDVVGTTVWMGTYICVYMMVREGISVLENINSIIPIVPTWLLKRMKDFNEKGEYIKKTNETQNGEEA